MFAGCWGVSQETEHAANAVHLQLILKEILRLRKAKIQPWLVWLSGLSASACELKYHWFDSQSGHMPVLGARSPIGGVQEATTP